MRNLVLSGVAVVALSACSMLPERAPQQDLGDFALGLNIVVAPNPYKGPGSRDASDEDLIAAVRSAIAEKFEPYEGDKLYNLGVSVDGYVLADVGLPVVLAPKSLLILNVTIWDDAAGEKLNEEPHQIAILEDFTAKTIIGSGLFSTGDQQLEMLAKKAAVDLEDWLVENPEWFNGSTDASGEVTNSADEG